MLTEKTPSGATQETARTLLQGGDTEPDFGIYIGTIRNGTALTLTAGWGYWFYSDAACTTQISGTVQNTREISIYVKAEEAYAVSAVTVANEDGTQSSVTPVQNGAVWQMTFPATLTTNQLIAVETLANAPGGIITTTSTATAVAAMFDGSATSQNTANVNVIASDQVFTVEIKNNIIQSGTIFVQQGVTLNLKSSGHHTIKRVMNSGNASTTFTGNLIQGQAGSTITLGAGYVTNNTITYHFSDGSAQTVAVSGQVNEPVPPEGTFITYADCNASVNNTMAGTLTIDGGFGDSFAPYSGTDFSSSSTVNCAPLINSKGTVQMWGDVTLQNNKSYSVDASETVGGGGINVNGTQGTLWMYGGTIRRMVNNRNSSDAGAIATAFGAMVYIYDCAINECETDTAAAIMIWGAGATGGLVFFNGSITRNYSAGLVAQYGGSAICTYNSSNTASAGSVKFFGGSVKDNSIVGIGNVIRADIKMSQGTPSDLYLYGGSIETIGSAYAPAMAFIYAASIEEIRWTTPSNVSYINGEYIATIPNAVSADGSVQISATARRGGIIFSDIVTAGSGKSTDLTMLLGTGNYEITINAPSMRKQYETVVSGENPTVTPVSRSMLAPTIRTQTDLTLTLNTAGTNNPLADGAISYGWSRTNSSSGISWQSDPAFNQLDQTGTYYFFVKAAAADSFPESVSPPLVVERILPTLDIGNATQSIKQGGVHTFEPLITPANYLASNVEWEISNANSADTRLARSNGNATITLGTDETAPEILLTARLRNDAGEYLATAVVRILTVYTQIENTPTYTISIPETVQLSEQGGSFNVIGQTVDFTTQTLQVSLRSANDFKLRCRSSEYSYHLFLDADHSQSINQNQVITVFNANATRAVSVYYAITDQPARYSGIYTDALTFTIVLVDNA